MLVLLCCMRACYSDWYGSHRPEKVSGDAAGTANYVRESSTECCPLTESPPKLGHYLLAAAAALRERKRQVCDSRTALLSTARRGRQWFLYNTLALMCLYLVLR